MAAYYHGIVVQRLLHLLHGGAKHVGTHLLVAQMMYLNIVAHRLYILQVGYMKRHGLVGSAAECKSLLRAL